MFPYHTTLDPDAVNTSQSLMLELVGGGKDVLDLGCATGYLAEALGARGCRVSGVEYVAEAAERARPFLEQLVVGDLNTLDLVGELGAERFDVLVFGDVLEHLADPYAVLRRALELLRPGGSVVISVPNVAHGSLRLALLQGRWRYTETGLLDRTHIRFFTRASLNELLRSSGLVPVDVRRTTADPLAVEVQVDAAALPPGTVEWVRAQPDADTYQFVVRAVRDQGDGVVEALALERDDLRRRTEAAERRAVELESALRTERESVQALLATRTMRALAAPRAVYSRLRRLGRRSR